MNDGSERHGHDHGSGHGPHHHQRHEHHDHHRGHHERQHAHGRDGGHHGPDGTHFLDLEISKVIYGEAASLTRDAARSILRGAIEARLREHLGAQLEEIGRIAADELIEDFQANVAIEDGIASRRDSRKATESRVREVLLQRGEGRVAKPAPVSTSASKRKTRA